MYYHKDSHNREKVTTIYSQYPAFSFCVANGPDDIYDEQNRTLPEKPIRAIKVFQYFNETENG